MCVCQTVCTCGIIIFYRIPGIPPGVILITHEYSLLLEISRIQKKSSPRNSEFDNKIKSILGKNLIDSDLKDFNCSNAHINTCPCGPGRRIVRDHEPDGGRTVHSW